MAITLPTVDEFFSFWGDEADDIDDDRAQLLINLSANLLWLATGLEDDPSDARMAQLVRYAICDMAIFLFVSRDDIDANYSPFVSERIGSYSYSKMYGHVMKAVTHNEATGVPLFDKVVAELIDIIAYGDGLIVGGGSLFPINYEPLGVEVARAHWWRPPFGSADNDNDTWYNG